MALTKEDLSEIRNIVGEMLKGDQANLENDFARWEKEGIKTKVGLLAPENYKEGDKEHFTWNEAMALDLPDGWRLPTMGEWAMICEEFGKDEDGRIRGDILEEKLKLSKNGYADSDDDLASQGDYAYYWSATVCSDSSYAYYLYFLSGSVYPANYRDKSGGFALRLIKGEL